MKNLFKFDLYKWGIFFEWMRYSPDWKRVDIVFAIRLGTRFDIFEPQKYLSFRVVFLKFNVKDGSEYGWGFDIPMWNKIKK